VIRVEVRFVDPHQFRRAARLIPDLAAWIGMDRWSHHGTVTVFRVPPYILMRSLTAVLDHIAAEVNGRVKWSPSLTKFTIVPVGSGARE